MLEQEKLLQMSLRACRCGHLAPQSNQLRTRLPAARKPCPSRGRATYVTWSVGEELALALAVGGRLGLPPTAHVARPCACFHMAPSPPVSELAASPSPSPSP